VSSPTTTTAPERVDVTPPSLAGVPSGAARGRAAVAPAAPGLRERALARWRADAALRDCWRALWMSRLLVWVVGVGAVLALGLKVKTSAFDPPGLTSGFGWLGDRLAAPGARWDSAWYLSIAQHGYEGFVHGAPQSSRGAFFPLYPALIGLFGRLGAPLVPVGLLVSGGAFAVALYGLHRLTALEAPAPLRSDAARLSVLALAFFPMSFFFSAVYSESLFLALSIGAFWSARHGRFVVACALAGCASATRNAGVVLLLPIALLYLYGPREDRPPDRPDAGRLQPRYRLRRDAFAAALVPLGVAVFMAYLAATGGDALLPFHAETVWKREFVGPIHTVWTASAAAFEGVRQVVSGQTAHRYFAAGHGNPLISAQHNVVDWLFAVAALVGAAGVLRRLPLAYGAYIVAALAMPLSYPVHYEPLMSLPRFAVVLFPLFMWAGIALARRPRVRAPALVASAALLALFVAQFATWHWVA
jgi:hypothetical protein